MKIEKQIEEIIERVAERVIERVLVRKMEMYDERLVSAQELSEHIAMFSKDWLERYGSKLPRENSEMTFSDGSKRTTRWCYPLHQIQREVREGCYRQLFTEKKS